MARKRAGGNKFILRDLFLSFFFSKTFFLRGVCCAGQHVHTLTVNFFTCSWGAFGLFIAVFYAASSKSAVGALFPYLRVGGVLVWALS